MFFLRFSIAWRFMHAFKHLPRFTVTKHFSLNDRTNETRPSNSQKLQQHRSKKKKKLLAKYAGADAFVLHAHRTTDGSTKQNLPIAYASVWANGEFMSNPLHSSNDNANGTRTLWRSLPNHSSASLIVALFRFDSVWCNCSLLNGSPFLCAGTKYKKISFRRKSNIKFSLSLCLFTDFSSTDFSCRPNDARHLSPHVNVNVMNVFQFSFGFFGGVLPLRPFYLHWHTMRFLFHSSLLCLLRFFFSVYATSFVLLFFVRFKNRHRHTATGHTLTHTVIYL